MVQKVLVGVHVGADIIRSAYVHGERLHELEDVRVSARGGHSFWMREDGALEFFAARDLFGVGPLDGVDATDTVLRAVNAALAQLDQEDLRPERIVIALPAAVQEFQRRHLLARLSSAQVPARLIDVTTAAFQAWQNYTGTTNATVAVLVAEDLGLEIAIARHSEQNCHILALETVTALSGRAINQHLLQTVIDRLPEAARARLGRADDKDLTALLERVTRSRARLARVAELAFGVRESGVEDAVVKLGKSDFESFITTHARTLEAALQQVMASAGLQGKRVDHVLVVGDLGESAEFANLVEKNLGSFDTAPLSTLADGAALAARQPFPPSDIREAPAPVSLQSYLDRLSRQRLQLTGRASGRDSAVEVSADNLEGTINQLFAVIGQRLTTSNVEPVRMLLLDIKARTERILAALPQPSAAAIVTSEPSEPAASNLILPARLAAGRSGNRRARRCLDDAERMLGLGRPLEAVSLSHQALEAAKDDHEILMALLDIHRRGAELLSGPENFEIAVTQLRCALEHRKTDELTARMLAERYIEHARYLESQGRFAEARQLLESALEYVDDDAASSLMKQIESLEGK